MGCTNPFRRGVGAPLQTVGSTAIRCPLGVGSKIILDTTNILGKKGTKGEEMRMTRGHNTPTYLLHQASVYL